MKGISPQIFNHQVKILFLHPGEAAKSALSLLASAQSAKPRNSLSIPVFTQKRGVTTLNSPPCGKNKPCSGKCKHLIQQNVQQNKKRLQTVSTQGAMASSSRQRSFDMSAEDIDEKHLQFSRDDAEMMLEVQVGNYKMTIPYIWLRDSCRSDKYFDHRTYQKKPDWDLLVKELKPVSVDSTESGQNLIIKWQDGHISKFEADWLTKNFFPGKFTKRVRRYLWDKEAMNCEPLPVVTFDDHMSTDEGLTQSLSNLVRYGFTVVSQAPPDASGTKAASERISEIQESVFGGLWTVDPKMANNDTAYTYDYLGAHTDTSYMASPAGIEVFHCVEHNGTGGETLLVDGFQIVEKMRLTDPEAFKMLTDTVVPFEYKEVPMDGKPSYHMISYNKLVELHPSSGELLSFRYNPYHRGIIDTVEPKQLQSFLAAYDKLGKAIQDPANEFWLKLRPGNVLFVDNWRVMHGRSAFTGFRRLSGCYLSRDEWISRARVYGVV